MLILDIIQKSVLGSREGLRNYLQFKIGTLKFSFFSLFFSVNLFSSDAQTHAAVDTIITHFSETIESVEGSKIYLNAENIFNVGETWLLQDSLSNILVLDDLNMNHYGFYVEDNGFNILNLWKCPYCSYWNHNDMNSCQKCYMPKDG